MLRSKPWYGLIKGLHGKSLRRLFNTNIVAQALAHPNVAISPHQKGNQEHLYSDKYMFYSSGGEHQRKENRCDVHKKFIKDNVALGHAERQKVDLVDRVIREP